MSGTICKCVGYITVQKQKKEKRKKIVCGTYIPDRRDSNKINLKYNKIKIVSKSYCILVFGRSFKTKNTLKVLQGQKVGVGTVIFHCVVKGKS